MNGKLKILLIASLALNLFALGGVAGALIMGARLGGNRTFIAVSPGGGPSLGSPLRAPALLDPEDSAALRSSLREAAEAGQVDRQAARDARRAAFELIARQPYDAKAVDAAFARGRVSELAARARIEAALALALQKVDATKRAELAQKLMRPPRFNRRSRPDGPPPPAPPPGD